ncbi:hypothetical protein, partial [Ruminococcus bicirculans (ex Wegman et al. 2014)]|uniref:hypothetical protein n=1 Tax=Ruminococcus bicirculans (ex Wegman et al. 2014) TaxID=1160721 RepID=UPI0024322CDB
LLEANPCSGFMSIEENIRHLKAQKSMLEFSLNSRKNTCDALQKERKDYESRLLTLRRLAPFGQTFLPQQIPKHLKQSF